MRFGARLREAAGGLEATLRVRRNVLSELASDLEDLYGAYRAEGLTGPEALRRAERVLAPSEEVLVALSQVHRPFPMRIADRFGDAGRHRLEWAFLVITTTAFCGIAIVLLLRGGIVPGPAPFAAVIVGLAFATLMYASACGLALYLGRWPLDGKPRFDSRVIVASACAVLVVAGLGGLLGLARAAGAIEADAGQQAVVLLHWVREASGLGSLGLLVVLADGLALLALRRRASLLMEEASRWRNLVSVVGQTVSVEPINQLVEEEIC